MKHRSSNKSWSWRRYSSLENHSSDYYENTYSTVSDLRSQTHWGKIFMNKFFFTFGRVFTRFVFGGFLIELYENRRKITWKCWSMEIRILFPKLLLFYPIVDQTQQRYCLCLCGDKLRSYMCPVMLPKLLISRLSFAGMSVLLMLTFHLPYLANKGTFKVHTYLYLQTSDRSSKLVLFFLTML